MTTKEEINSLIPMVVEQTPRGERAFDIFLAYLKIMSFLQLGLSKTTWQI